MTAPEQTYDVGILGWWYGKNYGSILTYYGLNRAIEELGFRTLMVHEALGYNGYRVLWPDNILSMDFARRVGYSYTQQVHFSELPALNARARTFVVGSDQLWNPVIGRVNDDLFLDFVGPENRRVAYATSFGNRGTAKFKPDFVARHSANLQKFSAISVREGYAVNTAREVFGVEATQVVDPVYLLPTSAYEALADMASVEVSGDYLAVFYLDPNPEKRNVALALAHRLGLDRILVIPNPDGGRAVTEELFADPRFEILEEDAPENFLHAYRSASYVVTDSFHGTAFATIFGKPFSSIYNTHRGVDRFKNLLNWMGFGDSRRLLETDTAETLAANPGLSLTLDYTQANARIAEGRARSLAWLQAALTAESGATAALAPVVAPEAAPGAASQETGTEAPGFPPATGFGASNDAWQISARDGGHDLTVAPGGAVRGNQVWCDLPAQPAPGSPCRLVLDWVLRTNAPAVNLHLRDPASGKFHVLGPVLVEGRVNVARRDSFDFIMPPGGFSQFMLGAVHFTGPQAGATITGLALEAITPAEMKTPAAKAVARPKGPSHAELALKLALDDNDRFVKAHAGAGKSVTSARARLMFHAHAIEKGLSRLDFRGGFGKISVPALAREMNAWLGAGRDPQDAFLATAASVMQAYFDRHRRINVDVSDFRALFGAPALARIEAAAAAEGGVLEAAADREPVPDVNPDARFLDVVYGRRSIRDFTAQPVAEADIARAVQLAMQAPSVCNRQAGRVHVFSDPVRIQAAIDIQGGFGGYNTPPRLLLVTADLNAFLFASERNQAFVDGGLFMMGLLLGLQHVGLGGCPLNTAMNTEREMALRKLLDIPDSEVFISFVAAGHYDPAILTPRSRRIGVEEVMRRHDLPADPPATTPAARQDEAVK
ncbi:polysaccharide pyruvyl transferase family protein [Gemmobacter denitrificans]|uniref:Polysaccharide pyruvyl transferase family protein n=1 Tax=Gemmobacter denitrificans TaxID=3123040 RepID=A0ABU8C038_9RHOB